MPKIFVTRPLPGEPLAPLRAAYGDEAVSFYPGEDTIPREALLAGAHGADAVLSLITERIDAAFFDAAGPQLKVVANVAVGYDNIDVPEATRRGIAITNTPGVLTETTADLAWALLLAAARRTGEAERFVRSGRWTTWSPSLLLGVDVYGKTLGIFGMGRIGEAVARRARGFGMKVLYHNRSRLPDDQEAALGAQYVDLPTLLTESDFVSLHCPLTPETRHAFGAAQFQAMKSTAVFVNTTRGPVVDEPALAAALRAGEIFAAGLDVFEEEPTVHPDLLACENAVVIPHLGSASQETRARMGAMAVANVLACLQGERPPNCLNPEVLS